MVLAVDFFGPLAHILKKKSKCKSYLIIRDIFPEWALDLGLIKRGLPYSFFKMIARYQYAVADTIGVQSMGNRSYFQSGAYLSRPQSVEVLENWVADTPVSDCPINLSESKAGGAKIFVLRGKIWAWHKGLDLLIDLAEQL
ncbi:MAG: glycosyltransferase family 4 protein, partial [Gammaproteobacteria bacterium]|nr:glycosyltransferase family 4 protein [Gammaproteobacteria bacterium]